MGPNFRYYSEISSEMLRKPSKNLSHYSRSPGRGLNQESSECEAGSATHFIAIFGHEYM
jgi:hypothetical protein